MANIATAGIRTINLEWITIIGGNVPECSNFTLANMTMAKNVTSISINAIMYQNVVCVMEMRLSLRQYHCPPFRILCEYTIWRSRQ